MLGVTSAFTTTSLGTDALTGVDLFISILPNQAFQANELLQMSHFLADGGTVFFIGDQGFATPIQNSNINAALANLGSTIRMVPDTSFDAGSQTASGVQIADTLFTAGISSFGYGAASELAVGDGTPLFLGLEGQPFAAFEETIPTPEPSTLLGMGALL